MLGTCSTFLSAYLNSLRIYVLSTYTTAQVITPEHFLWW